MSHTHEEIRALALKDGLGELTAAELVYVYHQEQYDLYALDDHIPLGAIANMRAARHVFFAECVSPERINNICVFAQRLTADETEGEE